MNDLVHDHGLTELSVICQRSCGNGWCSLYSVRIGDRKKLLIHIEEGGQSDFCLADGECSCVEFLYDTICEGNLCCEHLRDVVDDHNRLVRIGNWV